MEYGPFHQLDIDDVQDVLKKAQVNFEVVIKKEELEKVKAEYDERATTAPRAAVGNFDPAYIYFKISEEDYEKVSGLLEKYGVAGKSTGDELDGANYMCAKCRYSQSELGICPECKTELLPFEEYLKAKETMGSGMNAQYAGLAMLVLMGILWFVMHRN